MTNIAILRFADTTPAGRPLLSISVARHQDQIEKFTGTRPTISSVDLFCRMHPESVVTDPNPSARLDGNWTLSGDAVSQFFIGGVDGATYVITYLITFSDGSKEPFDAVISVQTFVGL